MGKRTTWQDTHRIVQQDGMTIEFDHAIVMDDGVVIRCDIYRPSDDGKYPAIITNGPYSKGMHFSQGYAKFWQRIKDCYPEILENTSGKYFNWETVDPEKWVPEGYACVRIDSRGAGRSEGVIDSLSPREIQDFYDCIEYIATLPWCDGNIGLNGISYFGISQWMVAAKQPPHLKCIIPFEGYMDCYRCACRHGGIQMDFQDYWWPTQVRNVQHGLGKRGIIGAITGDWLSGPEEVSDEELDRMQSGWLDEVDKEELITAKVYQDRKVDMDKVQVPLLSCGNWGGNALHLLGNVEGYLTAASKEKFLEIHGLEHYTEFFTDYGRKMQKAFLDHYLKGKDTWHQAPVHLRLRNVDGTFTDRDEQEWPLARTQWTKFYLQPDGGFSTEIPSGDFQITFNADDPHGLGFMSEPLEEEMEITGPSAGRLRISSDTVDADIYLTLRVLDPNGKDVTFVSANDYNGLIAMGWLRASHRKLVPEKTLPYRPFHAHDEKWPLMPGEKVDLDVEIWPTSVIIPKGYRVGINLTGTDYELTDESQWTTATPWGTVWKGSADYTHKGDSWMKELHGNTTLHAEGAEKPYILLPIIPKK